MADTTKYIVVQNTLNDLTMAFTFPALIDHDMFFHGLNDRHFNNRLIVLGAGFYDFKTNEVYGRSISLNVASREIDSTIIKRAFI